MLRFYTAGESHGQALLAFLSGLARFPARQRGLHQSRIAPAAAWLWARWAAEDRERPRGDFCRRAAWRDHWGTDRVAHRESRLGELGEDSAGGSIADSGSRGTKIGGAAAGSCRSGGIAKIQFSRRALHFGAGVGARDGCPRGGGRDCEATAARTGYGHRQPHSSGGAREARSPRSPGTRFARLPRTSTPRCGASMPPCKKR